MARPERFELPTPRFVVWCSIQLSYGRFVPLPQGLTDGDSYRFGPPLASRATLPKRGQCAASGSRVARARAPIMPGASAAALISKARPPRWAARPETVLAMRIGRPVSRRAAAR